MPERNETDDTVAKPVETTEPVKSKEARKKSGFRELPDELTTRIANLDGGAEALEAIEQRDLMEALSRLRRPNHERIEVLGEAVTDEEEKKAIKRAAGDDELSREVYDVCLRLRQRFPFGLR